MLRVMTYNIRNGLGTDGERSLARIADILRDVAPQVVCLQEVDRFLPRSGGIDQAAWLGERLGMWSVFQRNYVSGAGGMGNAVLSSLDLRAVCSHHLTSLEEPRGLLEVSLATSAGALSVFCTHLGLDAQERVTQVGEIAAAVCAAPGVKILCGDLNEVSSGPALSALMTTTGLLDAAPTGPPTYPSDAPAQRIDFVLHDPVLKAGRGPAGARVASDHLPVIVDLAGVG